MMIEGKELAIKVAEKLGESYSLAHFDAISTHYTDRVEALEYKRYLHDKAAQILFSEGIAGKINGHLWKTFDKPNFSYADISEKTDNWYACINNNGTLTPEKILNVWLEIED